MDEASLFSVVHSNKTKLEHKKFHTNMQKNFFMVRVTEHWNRLPRAVVESPLWRNSRPVWMPTYVSYCRVPALAGGLHSVRFHDSVINLF